jgi:hypothetical protein
MSLKERLSSISKGTQSVFSYLQSIETISDELSLIGHPLDDLDLVIYALNGLGPSFPEFTASIRTRDSPILFHELYDKQVDFEMFLQREESMNTSLPVTANHVQRRHPGNSRNRGRNYNNRVFDQAGSSTKKTDVVCQYCDIPDHSARSCYNIRGYPKKPRNPSAHVARVTPPTYPPPPSWLFDSGASHHITNDMNNLSIKSDYNGADNLQVANSNHLDITHIGSSTISTPSSNLKLSNVLCVPTVTQNLISVSQLCQTNRVSIEFFPWHFEVKDLRTGEMLLRGLNEDNVYKFKPTSSPHASLACTTPTLKLWHQRLGHPAHPTLLHALKTNNISFTESSNKCVDCLSNKSHKLPFS